MAYVKWTFWLILAAFVAGFLHYTLPKHLVVRVVESEVRRVEMTGWNRMFYASSEPSNTATGNREVKFISAVFPDGDTYVLRNEDTGWGWPPYFKFDSADVQARAADLISTAPNPQWAKVRYYGWRVPILSVFPNVLQLSAVPVTNPVIIPWFNIVFLTLLVASVLTVRAMLKRFWRRRVDPVVARVTEGFDEAEDAMDESQTRFRGRRQKFREWWIETFG